MIIGWTAFAIIQEVMPVSILKNTAATQAHIAFALFNFFLCLDVTGWSILAHRRTRCFSIV